MSNGGGPEPETVREMGGTVGERKLLDAYGSGDPAHQNAITTDRARPFHHESAFIRFRPYGSEGRLVGKNPLPENALAGI